MSNTYNVSGNVSNFVAGDNHGTMNAWTEVHSHQEAAGLLAAAIRLAALNGDFKGEVAEGLAKDCHDELVEAASASKSLEDRKRLADKVKDLGFLAASKAVDTTSTLLATEGVMNLLSAFGA